MHFTNVKIYLYVIVGISGALLFVLATAMGKNINNFLDFINIISKVITIDVVIAFLFIKWFWRFKYFQGWLVPFPDLNGTWEGIIQSNWKKDDGSTIAPIPTILVINQSFFAIHCTMYTQEMISYSHSESFLIDKEHHIKQLCYLYASNPKVGIQNRSPVHEGAMTFNIVGQKSDKLSGEYWTKRLTTGEVNLTFKCKEKADCFPEDMPPHPMQPCS
ncbi:hypothetical protein HMPREF1022_00536 [Desulfovibrio sp. 6_1_46AFAA]|uniref:Cap15 family cyclic dinucleotide receptor domain-containing protein n=1 Tax=Desulfovibrio sp. 6_1_46AFAA TaxID=665942 RepID=UPI0002236B4D|nr:hypothetical protein [Desulfovibrio sp. 6_1_46AFAA]EGW52563.1 hypothetical protein HMPREF1022_00536 [Desulfovibrio sp. 6_1_46AFAA]